MKEVGSVLLFLALSLVASPCFGIPLKVVSTPKDKDSLKPFSLSKISEIENRIELPVVDGNARTLPGDLKPILYQIKFQAYIDAPGVTHDKNKDQTFDGEVTIYVHAKNATSTIILNARQLSFPDHKNLKIYSLFEKEYIRPLMFVTGSQTITIELERQLREGEIVVVQIPYSGKIKENTDTGFYKSIDDRDTVYATQFETQGARLAFPCFDEPDYKAVFQLEIIKPKSLVAISNSMNVSTVDVGNGYESVTFEKTPYMSSYLVTFAIGDLVSLEGPSNETPITRVWSFRSGKDQMKVALDSARKCTKAMTKYTNFTLPLKKIDHLAIPFKNGAMENFGLIIYSKDMLLYNSNIYRSTQTAALQTWMQITGVICHELSHHWFGDTVTNTWWGDVWLHEGYADYFENTAMALMYPKESEYMDYQFAITNGWIQNSDKKRDAHPIITKNGAFDQFTYGKGGLIIRQLAAVIGPKSFQKGLQNYLRKYQFSNANYKDLISAVQEIVNKTNLKDWCGESFNVLEYFETWLIQGDHPLLEVDYRNGNYLLSQKTRNNSERFWPLPIFTQDPDGEEKLYWSAPNHTCSNGKQLPQTLKIKSPLLFINRDGLSVMETSYSQSALLKITDALTSFSHNLQLSAASIRTLLTDIANSKNSGMSTEHYQNIVQNILMRQKSAFAFGIFNDLAYGIEDTLSQGKFDNILQKLSSS